MVASGTDRDRVRADECDTKPHRRIDDVRYVRARMRVTATALLLASLVASPARACPCASSDPALTQPSAPTPHGPAMFRLGAELRLTLDAYGEASIDRADVVEVRLEHTVQFTPLDGLVFTAIVPVAYREVTRANLSVERVLGLADPELRGRLRLLRAGSSEEGFSHELDVVVGVDLPIQPEMVRPDGTPVSMEAMIASGSADPLAGLLYRFFEGPFGLVGALTWRIPTSGAQGMTMGPSLDGSLLLSGFVLRELSFRGAVEGRYELAAQMPNGPMPNTGGGLVRVGGDVLVHPVPELTIAAGMRGPVIDAMNGDRDPGITASLLVMGEVNP